MMRTTNPEGFAKHHHMMGPNQEIVAPVPAHVLTAGNEFTPDTLVTAL